MQEDFIEKELVKYNLSDSAIARLKAQYLPMVVTSKDDMDGYLECKEGHIRVKKIISALEATRKDLNVDALTFTRAINGEAKRLTASVKEIADHLELQRKVVEDEKERIAEEKAREVREEEERIKREEEARLEAQRKEQEERERILQEEADRLAAEKKANEEEKARLAAEADRQEREKKEAEAAKFRAEVEEKRRKDQEKRHAEEVKKAEEEAAARAIREKEEKEEADRIEAENAKLRAPDKEKIFTYAKELYALPVPQTKTTEAMTIIADARYCLLGVVDFLKKEASKL